MQISFIAHNMVAILCVCAK